MLDTITKFFPDAGEVHVSGTSEEAVKVHSSGKIIHTFAPNDTTDYVHHLVIRPNGKYILKLDSGDGGHSKDDFVLARGRTPLMSGDTSSSQGKTTFHLVNNKPDSNGCTLLCFEKSNRRKERRIDDLQNNELIPVVQHGDDGIPIALTPKYDNLVDESSIPSGGFTSHDEFAAHLMGPSVSDPSFGMTDTDLASSDFDFNDVIVSASTDG